MSEYHDDADLEDWEYPDPDHDDDALDIIPCPDCGAEVYEDANHCPRCGHLLTASTDPWQGRPWWWIALGLLGVISVVGLLVLY